MEVLEVVLLDLLRDARLKLWPPLDDAMQLCMRIMHETATGLEYLHTVIGPESELLAAKGLFYLVLAAHVLHYRALTSKVDPWLFAAFAPFVGRPGCNSYEELLNAHLKTLTRVRVVVVLLAMWATVGSGEHPLHYLLGVPFVWAVYNGGNVPPMAKKASEGGRSTINWNYYTWINAHHLGAVVAYAYQSTEDAPTRVWHNTAFFTWVWIIHTFGFLQDWLLPMLGMPKPKGSKDGVQFKVMQAVRYAYGAASVALFYGYLMEDGMPGFGANYQTAAVLGMVVGRLLAGKSYWRIPFIKWVEAPGFAAVSVWHLLVQQRYEWAAATAFVVGWYVRQGCLLPPPAVPAPKPAEPASVSSPRKPDQTPKVLSPKKSDPGPKERPRSPALAALLPCLPTGRMSPGL